MGLLSNIVLALVLANSWIFNRVNLASSAPGGGDAIEFVNSSSVATAASGSVTLNAPSSPQNDDLWLAITYVANTGTTNISDWTELGSNSNITVHYFRYAGSTPNLVATVGAGGESIQGIIAVFRHVKRTGSPANVNGSLDANVGTTITIQGVTPTVPNTMLLATSGSNGNVTFTNPSGFTQIYEGSTTLGTPDSTMGVYYKTHTTGATGNFSQTISASSGWISKLTALETQ